MSHKLYITEQTYIEVEDTGPTVVARVSGNSGITGMGKSEQRAVFEVVNELDRRIRDANRYRRIRFDDVEKEEAERIGYEIDPAALLFHILDFYSFYRCKKCGHFSMKGYICSYCGIDPTDD